MGLARTKGEGKALGGDLPHLGKGVSNMQAGLGSPGLCTQTNLRGNLCPASDWPQEAIWPFWSQFLIL